MQVLRFSLHCCRQESAGQSELAVHLFFFFVTTALRSACRKSSAKIVLALLRRPVLPAFWQAPAACLVLASQFGGS